MAIDIVMHIDEDKLCEIAENYYRHRRAWRIWSDKTYKPGASSYETFRLCEEAGAAEALVKVLALLTGIDAQVWQDTADSLHQGAPHTFKGVELVHHVNAKLTV